MITALSWVPRGAARAKPVRFELSPEEYGRIKELAKLEEEAQNCEETAGNDVENAADGEEADGIDTTDLPPELRMDEYDDDEYTHNESFGELEEAENFAMIEQGDVALAMDEEDDEEDAEDNEIKPTDSLLVVALTEDEYSHLEVQLIADDGTIFVHHDISLPEFPLCLAWTDCPPFQADGGQIAVGNYIAVGTFNPAIEIWNLDVLDPLEPSAVLGGVIDEKKHSKKKGKKGMQEELRIGSHEDAVMGLSWNKTYRFALASGSADMTVKIWDMTTQKCSHTFTHHNDKVQSVSWHPEEAWLLATGSFDKSLALLDCRSGTRAASFNIPSDIEAMAWDPFHAFNLYSTLEDGQVQCIDVRVADTPLFTFRAHEKTASSISFSSSVPGMFATASIDKTVKVWDSLGVQDYSASVLSNKGTTATAKGKAKSGSGFEPRCVAYKTMNVGKLFALQFYSDDPFMLATAGDKGMVAIWETDESEVIRNHFESRTVQGSSVYSSLTTADASSNNDGATAKPFAIATLAEQVVPQNAEMEDDSWMDEPTDADGRGAKKEQKKKKSKGKK